MVDFVAGRLVVREVATRLGVVHVRDMLTTPPHTTAADLRRPVLTLPASTPAYAALSTMRLRRSHLALVESHDQLLGLLTLQDLLDRLLPAEHHTAT